MYEMRVHEDVDVRCIINEIPRFSRERNYSVVYFKTFTKSPSEMMDDHSLKQLNKLQYRHMMSHIIYSTD